jgi:hypothetical protein
VPLLDENDHVNAIHPGHHNVADNQLRTATFDFCQRALSIIERGCIVPGVAKYHRQRVSNTFFIIHDKNSSRHHFTLSSTLNRSEETSFAPAL